MKAPARRLGPLADVWVAVTRAEPSDGPLTRQLTERGATVLHWPVVRFDPPEDSAPLDAALARLSAYDGIVFTSPRAVAAVCGRAERPVGRPWVAAVGETTRAALERAGWRVDEVPETASSSELALELADLAGGGARILFPASSIARRDLPQALRELGARVDRVTAYRTSANRGLDPDDCLEALAAAPLLILTFASPSAIRALCDCLGEQTFEHLLSRCPAAVIGRTTAEALRQAGVEPAAIAAKSTMAGLAEAAVLATNPREDS